MYQNTTRGIFVRVDNGVMDEYMKPAKRNIKIISSERYEGGDDLDCGGRSSAAYVQPVPPSQLYHPPPMKKKGEQPPTSSPPSMGQGDGRSTAAMRTCSCKGTARSREPATKLPPYEYIQVLDTHIRTYIYMHALLQ